ADGPYRIRDTDRAAPNLSGQRVGPKRCRRCGRVGANAGSVMPGPEYLRLSQRYGKKRKFRQDGHRKIVPPAKKCTVFSVDSAKKRNFDRIRAMYGGAKSE
ncbi:MAG: hypothetical protein K2H81_07095, partial [Alistipes sp.]|nr:hypothetical protein [Alistipes sp.]